MGGRGRQSVFFHIINSHPVASDFVEGHMQMVQKSNRSQITSDLLYLMFF